ncbi:MAG: fumarylacetoacetate hydrolase family protein [Gemmatimonadota bacterium]
MRVLQFADPADGRCRVGLVEGDQVLDLTGVDGQPATLHDVYYRAGGDRDGLEAALERARAAAQGGRRLSLAQLAAARPGTGQPHLVKPVSGPPGIPYALRIWLAGVTHADSARLREIEAKQATGDQVNVYEQKYRETAGGGRPELFPKVDPDSVVGHGEGLTRPADTERLVPETELVTVYGVNARGQVERLGYTGGNDATDNGIEATNPLNLPQAKNWEGGCASLGPLLVTAAEFDDGEVRVSCVVLRAGRRAAYKEGRTGQRHLNMPDGLYHMEQMLFRRLPLGAGQLQALYWGTPIVFAEADLAGGLKAGDVVRMTFSGGIGTLETPVVALGQTAQLAGLRP